MMFPAWLEYGNIPSPVARPARMSVAAPALLASLLAATGFSGPAAAEVQLLSAEGEVRLGRSPASQAAGLPSARVLRLGASARAQLLITSGVGAELAVSVRGPARLLLLGPAAEVEVEGGERLRVAGTGRLRHSLFQLELRDSSAVLEGHWLFITRGSVRIERRRPAASRPQQGPLGEAPAPSRLAAGQRLELGADGGLSVAAGSPAPAVMAELDRFVAPRWRPVLPRVSIAQVHQAERLADEQRRAERETASCGCTESKGSSGAPQLGTGPGITPFERHAATLRVQITGVPRSR